MKEYDELYFKIPIESKDYHEASNFVIKSIEGILAKAIRNGENKIIINTNLRNGLPMENINKIAGPIVEAWASELFESISQDNKNEWNLVHSEACSRLGMADIKSCIRNRTNSNKRHSLCRTSKKEHMGLLQDSRQKVFVVI